jgi:hypothetical protein
MFMSHSDCNWLSKDSHILDIISPLNVYAT